MGSAMDSEKYAIRCMMIGDSVMEGVPTRSGLRGRVQEALKGRPIEFVGPFTDKDGCTHAAFSGHSIKNILKNLPELLTYRPDMAVFMAGGNGLPDTEPSEIEREIATVLAAFLRNGTSVIYLSKIADVEGFSDQIAAYNAAIERVSDSHSQIHLIDIGKVVGKANRGSPFYSDPAHPNQLGYDAMGAYLLGEVFGIKDASPSAAVGGGDIGDPILRAKEVIDEAYPRLAPALCRYALAVGNLRSFGERGDLAPWNMPSHNWGALPYRARRDPSHFDLRGVRLAKFPSAEEGCIAFVEAWATPEVRRAVATGDTVEVASAMGDADGAPRLQRSLEAVAKTLGEQPCGGLATVPHFRLASVGAEPEPTGSPFSWWNVGVLGVVGLIFGATLGLKGGGGRKPS
jgi:lysophospholipase L1-like esterase